MTTKRTRQEVTGAKVPDPFAPKQNKNYKNYNK